MRNLLFLAFLSILASACGPDYLYEKSFPVSEEGWAYADTVDFSFAIDDTSAVYNLYLEIDHSPDYAYQNLYARIHTRFPSGERKSQVISLELADKTGAWQGDCGKNTCAFLAPIQRNAFFKEAGAYVITLEQYMRETPIAGITAIGFKIERTDRDKNPG